MERTITERLVSEFVGAFAIVFIGAGAIVMSTTFGADRTVALLVSALAFGLAVAVMVSSVGHVSGGHFNPAVTIGAWITQKIKSTDALGYILAQLAGGAVGALLLRACLPSQVVRQAKYGVTEVVRGLSNGQGVLIEAILTFFLVWVIFATAIDPDGSFGKIAGLPIGFAITMGTLMGGNFTGAAMNPARHFGPAAIGGFWDNWWVFWVGPVAGAIVAAAAYDGLIIRRPGSAALEEQRHGFGAHGEPTPLVDEATGEMPEDHP